MKDTNPKAVAGKKCVGPVKNIWNFKMDKNKLVLRTIKTWLSFAKFANVFMLDTIVSLQRYA